jgi:heme oxygenase
MGDLSGGQLIGRALARHHPDVDLRFYDFGDLDVTATKDAYRAALDAAPWDTAERDSVIDEVHAAYELNTRLFVDLGVALLA